MMIRNLASFSLANTEMCTKNRFQSDCIRQNSKWIVLVAKSSPSLEIYDTYNIKYIASDGLYTGHQNNTLKAA